MAARSHQQDDRRIQDLSAFVNRTSRIEQAEVVWHQLKDFAAKLGMPYLLAVAMAKIETKFKPALLFTDSPNKLMDALDKEWPPASNPVLEHSQTVLRPFAMSEVTDHETCFGFDWRKFAPTKARAGDALVVPIANGQLNGIAVFAGHKPDLGVLARALLQVAAQYAFQRANAISRSGQHKSRPTLTRRERECLRLAAMGKKDAQIAEAMGITIRTVRFHCANAKAKLGVSSRGEAIAMTASAKA